MQSDCLNWQTTKKSAEICVMVFQIRIPKQMPKISLRFTNQDPATFFGIDYINEYVGNISLVPCEDIYRKSAEIGYFIGEPYWNKGIVTTAVNLITDYGFNYLGIVRIQTGIFEYNTASQRVLEKCGFLKEGIFRKSVYKQGKLWDEVRYAKLKAWE